MSPSIAPTRNGARQTPPEISLVWRRVATFVDADRCLAGRTADAEKVHCTDCFEKESSFFEGSLVV